jgi:hypothetical protein
LAAHGARADRYLAEHLEHQDQQHTTTVPGGVPEQPLPARELPRVDMPSQASLPARELGSPQAPRSGTPAHFQGEDVSVDEVHRRWIASRNNSVAMPSQASSATVGSNAPTPMHPHPRDTGIDSPDEDMDVDDNDAMGFIGSLEPSAEDYASEILLQQLGSSAAATDVKPVPRAHASFQRCTLRHASQRSFVEARSDSGTSSLDSPSTSQSMTR